MMGGSPLICVAYGADARDKTLIQLRPETDEQIECAGIKTTFRRRHKSDFQKKLSERALFCQRDLVAKQEVARLRPRHALTIESS